MQDNMNALKIQHEPAKGGKMKITAVWHDKPVCMDVINPARADDRQRFFGELSGRLPAIKEQAQIIDEMLMQVAMEASSPPTPPAADGTEVKAAESPEELLAQMPEEIRNEARAILLHEDLAGQIRADIEAMGVAGERDISLSLYCVGTSRLLPKPLACILRGKSSSGKSHPISRTAAMFPPEAVVRATQLSPQVLFYMPPGSLSHKYVVCGERSRKQDDDMAEATRALREMLSEGQLDKYIPVKVNGELVSRHVHQDGPIAYVESTTVERVFDEDANRCIVLQTDEGPEQTRRVLKVVAAGYQGQRDASAAERIVQKHWAAQRMLVPMTVVVPYAERLADAMPDGRVEVRRTIGHVMGMITTITLLHQLQRCKDNAGRLIATPGDYALARQLLEKPLRRALGQSVSDGALEFYGRLKTRFPDVPFTVGEASTSEPVGDRQVRNWITELDGAKYVQILKPGRGTIPDFWQISPDAPVGDGKAVLPTVEELFPQEHFRLSDKEEVAAA